MYGTIRVSNLWYCKKTISEKVEQYAAESIETVNKKKKLQQQMTNAKSPMNKYCNEIFCKNQIEIQYKQWN